MPRLTKLILAASCALVLTLCPDAWSNDRVEVINAATNPVPVFGTSSTSTTGVSYTQGLKAVATAGTPVLLVAAQNLVESVEIFARKNTTTANTGNVYVGFSSTGGSNFRVLAPGESLSMTAPAGKKLDLHQIYIDAATNADAVVFSAIN